MAYNYHLQPSPIRPVQQMKKYFFTVLFIKSYIYNVKGQAIIFRRKSLESLMKLLNDFDETYLHTSYEHSYQNKRLSENNVDFLVKYTDDLDEVISLIDQNSFTIKLSWQVNKAPTVFPAPTTSKPPCIPPPTLYECGYDRDSQLFKLKMFIENAIQSALNSANKKVKICSINTETETAEVRQWDETTGKYISLEYTVKIDPTAWIVGQEAILVNGQYLQRTSLSTYKRVKVTDVSKISTEGKITVRQFNDDNKKFIGKGIELDLRTYCYGDKIPSWHVNDDALLFDNKYLQKLDVPEVYGFNGDGTSGSIVGDYGLTWSDTPEPGSSGVDWGDNENNIGSTGDPLPPEIGQEFGDGEGD